MKYMYVKSEWTLKKNKQTHLERMGKNHWVVEKNRVYDDRAMWCQHKKTSSRENFVTISNSRNVCSSSLSSSSMLSVIAHVWDYNILSANIAPLHAKNVKYCSVCLLQTTQPTQLYSQWNLLEKLVQVANFFFPPAQLLCIIIAQFQVWSFSHPNCFRTENSQSLISFRNYFRFRRISSSQQKFIDYHCAGLVGALYRFTFEEWQKKRCEKKIG